uniref:prepilin-type N-terminal cleavage/methylation domain-containing protein n=1 Tax=Acetatifactor sp. TaxID=1872090 RepID=UPI0040567599
MHVKYGFSLLELIIVVAIIETVERVAFVDEANLLYVSEGEHVGWQMSIQGVSGCIRICKNR